MERIARIGLDLAKKVLRLHGVDREGRVAVVGQMPVLRLLLALLLSTTSARAADLGVAFIGNLSGADANIAQDQLDGFRLGVHQLGGRLGGVEFALTVVDDRHDPALAKRAAEHLWQGDRLHILLLSAPPATGLLLAPLAAAQHTLVINLGNSSAHLAGRSCNPNFFSLAALADTMHEMTGQYLDAQGYHHLAVVGPDNAAATQALAAFRRGFRGQVTEVWSHRGAMDFSSDLRRLKDARPDGVYLLHSGGMAVEFLLQFAGSGLRNELPLFGPASTLDRMVLAASSPAALDAFSVGPWSDDLDAPANRRLVADFENEYGRPVSSQAAVGYDAAMLLDAAVKAADRKVNDEDALRNALRRVDFPSTRGSFHFDNNQFPILTYVVRQVVEDSRGRPISEQRGVLQRDVHDGHAAECPMRRITEPAPPKR